jgi:hypothetical protein
MPDEHHAVDYTLFERRDPRGAAELAGGPAGRKVPIGVSSARRFGVLWTGSKVGNGDIWWWA